MKTVKTLAWFILLAGVLIVLGACAPADTSKARSRAVIQSGGIVSTEELRVAEYLNYYEQKFPQPVGAALGLDLRLGNPQIPTAGGEAWLQIGIQAQKAGPTEIAPLNLALVIDRSGSMNTPEKMPYVKQSLRVFLGSLAANDIVAIIAYSDAAEVLAAAREVGDGQWISAVVDRLQPAGSTNLHAGLLLGFREVERRFDPRRNNRVILLTDGIANVGETNSDRIAAAAKAYNERGIYLSTIGLGREFNDSLLIKLANQGQGAYHFVDSAQEMDKVFRREALGLLQKAASDVSATIRPAEGVRLIGLTGYEGSPPAAGAEVRLRDMGTGDSQALLARLSIGPGAAGARLLATVELRYTEEPAGRAETVSLPVYADAGSPLSYDPLWDVEVLRNATIQRMAEGLKEIDRLYRAARYQEAYDIAYRLEQDLRRVAALTREDQMVKDADLMRQYQGTLSRWIESQTGRGPEVPKAQPTRFYRGQPAPPVIEVK
jgi:Ca-activated chloride channel family protein